MIEELTAPPRISDIMRGAKEFRNIFEKQRREFIPIPNWEDIGSFEP